MECSSRLLQFENLLHVNSGHAKFSYARNSSVQKSVAQKARTELEVAVKAAYNDNNTASKSFPEKFVIADLGCGSGPNSLHAISVMTDTIFRMCKEKGHTPPEMLVFLNDLPGNDFNHVFNSLANFYHLLKKESDIGHVFMSGIPGSFYGRLLPLESVNIFHSSCSLHWLPQVPEGIQNNKRNIYISKTSPENVYKAYKEEFKKDFTIFLRCRAKELLPKGQMVLSFIGRDTDDPIKSDSVKFWDLITQQFLQLSSQGFIKEADIDSFNVPFYHPYCEEVKSIVEEEGFFEIDSFRTFRQNWYPSDHEDVFDRQTNGQKVADCMRAVLESCIAGHFGEDIIDELFARYARSVGEHLAMENTQYTILVLSMSNKP